MILSPWTLVTLTNWFLLNSHPRNVHSLKVVNVDIITLTGKILIPNNPLVKINGNSFHNSGLSLPIPSYLRHNRASTEHAIFGVTCFIVILLRHDLVARHIRFGVNMPQFCLRPKQQTYPRFTLSQSSMSLYLLKYALSWCTVKTCRLHKRNITDNKVKGEKVSLCNATDP